MPESPECRLFLPQFKSIVTDGIIDQFHQGEYATVVPGRRWMSKAIFFLWGILLSVMPSEGYSLDTCRCGDRLISIGDTISAVLERCGSPTQVDKRAEQRLERVYGAPYTERGLTREPIYAKVEVSIEEWLYNFGPARLTLSLFFENGKLVKIETGHYGY